MDKIIFILTAFILSITLVLAIPIRVYRMECDPNPDVCFNSQCNVKTIRKKITLINFGCIYKEPQDNVTVHVILYKKSSGAYKSWMINVTESLCNAMDKTSRSNLLSRVLPTVYNFASGSSKCPLLGNNSMVNSPLDLSFVPALIPQGEYRLDATLLNPAHKLTSALVFFRIG